MNSLENSKNLAAEWFDLAHTFNGYEEAGSFERCSTLHSKVCERIQGGEYIESIDTFDLRCALFFIARAVRHEGGDPSNLPRFVSEIVSELRRRGVTGSDVGVGKGEP